MKHKEIEINCKEITEIHHQKVWTIDKLGDKKKSDYLVSLANQTFSTPLSESELDFHLESMVPSEVCVWVREHSDWKNIYILRFDY